MNLYITYGDSEFGTGRKELEGGKWILYAGSFQLDLADALFNDSRRNVCAAEANLARVLSQAEADIQAAEAVYVYVGVNAMHGAMALIKKLIGVGKKVVMTGCDCAREEKETFAARHGIECILTRTCGSGGILTKLIEGGT